MAYALRPLVAPDDYPRLAEIMTANFPERMTATELVEADKRVPSGTLLTRLFAVDDTGHAAGYGLARHQPHDKPGYYFLRVLVDPDDRHQGAGTLLANEVERAAVAQGATLLECEIRENDPNSLAFARSRGYQNHEHVFESVLTVADFAEDRFADVVESLKRSGLRFFTLADALAAEGVKVRDPAHPFSQSEQKFYDIVWTTAQDEPTYDWAHPPAAEEWVRSLEARSNFRPNLIFVAADGDRWVGYTIVAMLPTTGAMLNGGTGVDSAYRGRNISLAVKALSIQAARAAGATYLRTNNSSLNGAMLAVNRKLGYVPAPGYIELRKKL